MSISSMSNTSQRQLSTQKAMAALAVQVEINAAPTGCLLTPRYRLFFVRTAAHLSTCSLSTARSVLQDQFDVKSTTARLAASRAARKVGRKEAAAVNSYACCTTPKTLISKDGGFDNGV